MVFRLHPASRPPGEPHQKVQEGPQICISNELPSGADVAGPGTPLWEPLMRDRWQDFALVMPGGCCPKTCTPFTVTDETSTP